MNYQLFKSEINFLLPSFLEYTDGWCDDEEFYKNDISKINCLCSQLAHYIEEGIIKKTILDEELVNTFNYLESLMCKYKKENDLDIYGAIGLCFIESLINTVKSKESSLELNDVIKYFGREMSYFNKELNMFWHKNKK